MPKRNCDTCHDRHETLRCPSCVDKTRTNYVINGLLTYVWSYVNEYSPASLKDAVIRHFDPADITQARSALQGEVKDILPNYREIQGNRASSVGREKHEIEADDICGAMVELTKLIGDEAQSVPVFVVDDVRKLPKITPEEHNAVSVLEKVIMMQQQLDKIASSVATNQRQLVTHDTMLSRCNNRIETLEGKESSYASRVRSQQSGGIAPVPQAVSAPPVDPAPADTPQADTNQNARTNQARQTKNQMTRPNTPRQATPYGGSLTPIGTETMSRRRNSICLDASTSYPIWGFPGRLGQERFTSIKSGFTLVMASAASKKSFSVNPAILAITGFPNDRSEGIISA